MKKLFLIITIFFGVPLFTGSGELYSAEKNKNRCQECFKKLNDTSSLKRHMRIHTGERPFNCPTCGQSFLDKTNLKRHMNIHTKDNPHKCPVDGCPKKYARNSSLKDHLWDVHGIIWQKKENNKRKIVAIAAVAAVSEQANNNKENNPAAAASMPVASNPAITPNEAKNESSTQDSERLKKQKLEDPNCPFAYCPNCKIFFSLQELREHNHAF